MRSQIGERWPRASSAKLNGPFSLSPTLIYVAPEAHSPGTLIHRLLPAGPARAAHDAAGQRAGVLAIAQYLLAVHEYVHDAR